MSEYSEIKQDIKDFRTEITTQISKHRLEIKDDIKGIYEEIKKVANGGKKCENHEVRIGALEKQQDKKSNRIWDFVMLAAANIAGIVVGMWQGKH